MTRITKAMNIFFKSGLFVVATLAVTGAELMMYDDIVNSTIVGQLFGAVLEILVFMGYVLFIYNFVFGEPIFEDY